MAMEEILCITEWRNTKEIETRFL